MTAKTKKQIEKTAEFDYKTIKSFEDACAKEGIDPAVINMMTKIPAEFIKPIVAAFKLMVIYKAINNGWVPDWGKSNQYKYYPWYWVLSSGFGFVTSNYRCTATDASVGSRLCTDSSEKAMYIAKQFGEEYKDYLLYPEQ